MRSFTLEAEFIDAATEQAVIAAIAENPELFWRLHDLIPEGAFSACPDAWQRTTDAIRNGHEPPTLEGWTAASDPIPSTFLKREGIEPLSPSK